MVVIRFVAVLRSKEYLERFNLMEYGVCGCEWPPKVLLTEKRPDAVYILEQIGVGAKWESLLALML